MDLKVIMSRSYFSPSRFLSPKGTEGALQLTHVQHSVAIGVKLLEDLGVIGLEWRACEAAHSAGSNLQPPSSFSSIFLRVFSCRLA